MEIERPPDPGNWDLDTSSIEDKINAYDAVASSHRDGIQPAIYLTHSFLQDHPILLEEGYLTVNWDRIPGLYTRTDKLLTMSITDAQWEKWGWPGGWTAWEPDTWASNFIPNMAVVVCKGIFHDALDPQLQNKVGHFMTIARVPECIELLPFDQLHEAFNGYHEAATTVGLVRLHRSNMVFPDVYFQFYGEHFTIMGLSDPEIWFGTADEFVGSYLVCWHVASSRFCMVEAPAKEWSFNDTQLPWILPASYRNPNETVPDFPDDDNGAGGSLGKDSGSTPLMGASAKVKAVDDEEADDDGFEMVDDGDEEPGDKVVITISTKEVKKPEGSRLFGKAPMFESEEEDDPEIKKQIEDALDAMGLMEELMLSEQNDESESESSDDKDDLDETKDYHKDQEEGTGEPGSKLSSPKAVGTGPAAVPEGVGNPTVPRPDTQSETPCRPNPEPPRARVPAMRVPARSLLPNCNFQPQP